MSSEISTDPVAGVQRRYDEDEYPQSSHLLRLPQELRDDILRLCIHGPYEIWVRYPISKKNRVCIDGPNSIMNLALTCKMMKKDSYKIREDFFTGEVWFDCSGKFDFQNVTTFVNDIGLQWAAQHTSKVILNHLFNKQMDATLHTSLLSFQNLEEIHFETDKNLYLKRYAARASLSTDICRGLYALMSEFSNGIHDQSAIDDLGDYHLHGLAAALQEAGRKCKVLLKYTFYVRPMDDRYHGPMPAGVLHTVVSLTLTKLLEFNLINVPVYAVRHQPQFADSS